MIELHCLHYPVEAKVCADNAKVMVGKIGLIQGLSHLKIWRALVLDIAGKERLSAVADQDTNTMILAHGLPSHPPLS
jgi:hypothetical protein